VFSQKSEERLLARRKVSLHRRSRKVHVSRGQRQQKQGELQSRLWSLRNASVLPRAQSSQPCAAQYARRIAQVARREWIYEWEREGQVLA